MLELVYKNTILKSIHNTEINIKDSSYGFETEDLDVGFDIHKNMYGTM